MTDIVEIRLTEDYEIQKVKLLKDSVFKADRVMLDRNTPCGWRLQESFGQYPRPFIEIGFAEEVVERTYTESEMKEIRRAWEEKLADAEDSIKGWRDMYSSENAERIKLKEENKKLLSHLKNVEREWMEEVERVRSKADAKQRRLDLFTPEIERIEAAVARVVPEDIEGTLAEHVERMADELIGMRLTEEYKKAGFPIVFASVEGKHPEDEWEKQENELSRWIKGAREKEERRIRHMR